jgi:hypothetical protein
MDAREFTEALTRMPRGTIESVAAAIELNFATAEGELAWWKAHLAIHDVLKNQGALRQAASAAHHASGAVLRAATNAGMAMPNEIVTRVAREAQEVARGIVAGGPATPSLEHLLQSWTPLVAVPLGV